MKIFKSDASVKMGRQLSEKTWSANRLYVTLSVIMKPATAFRLSAAVAFFGVALGAFGAHALQARLIAFDTVKTWGTASLYHLVHAVVLLAISRDYLQMRFAWWAFFVGVVIFSGSLYVLAVTNLKILGAITPIGGLCFLAGWGALVLKKEP